MSTFGLLTLLCVGLANGLKCHTGSSTTITTALECAEGITKCKTLTAGSLTGYACAEAADNSKANGCDGLECYCDSDLCNVLEGEGAECYNIQPPSEEHPLGNLFKVQCSGNIKNCAEVQVVDTPVKIPGCGKAEEVTDGQCVSGADLDANISEVCYCNGDSCNGPTDKENGVEISQPKIMLMLITFFILFKF